MTDPERITCNCGDESNPHICGKVHPQADANDRRCDRMLYGSIGVLLCVGIVVGVALWGCK